jgi:hypothetical protein
MKKNIPAEHQRYNMEVDGAILRQGITVTDIRIASIALLAIFLCVECRFDLLRFGFGEVSGNLKGTAWNMLHNYSAWLGSVVLIRKPSSLSELKI